MIKEDKKIEKKYVRKLFRILKKENFCYKERCDKRREKYKVGIQKRGWRK